MSLDIELGVKVPLHTVAAAYLRESDVHPPPAVLSGCRVGARQGIGFAAPGSPAPSHAERRCDFETSQRDRAAKVMME